MICYVGGRNNVMLVVRNNMLCGWSVTMLCGWSITICYVGGP